MLRKIFNRRIHRFAVDKTAVAAVEFALILPFLLLLLIGMAETTSALNQDRRVSQVASSVTDLVAQSKSMSSNDMTDIMKAVGAIMAPYNSAALEVIVASVTFDDEGEPKVDWSVNKDGNTPDTWIKGQKPPIDIPETISIAGTSLVFGSASYKFIPKFAGLSDSIFPGAALIQMGDHYFLKPRITATVTFN
ncbi:TadE/TadG family type IV pilus assembly protein [Roseibium algae]|uniref:TadE/TadG family type IV pilus assembly protein n=1 Tax=Roseibium algae TaxID=3123038 RepID=A0ABU8TRN5_9HYPH